jgi:L-alanine-DL-glutamate epimerase-like enolase superfamily enzyme
VCTAASAHGNLNLPNLGPQEQARPYGWDDTGVIVAGGTVVPAGLPELGVEIGLTAIRRATPVIMNPPPRFRRDDGSFTNW